MPPDLIFFMGSIPSLGKLAIDEAGKNTLSLKQNNSLYLYYLFFSAYYYSGSCMELYCFFYTFCFNPNEDRISSILFA